MRGTGRRLPSDAGGQRRVRVASERTVRRTLLGQALDHHDLVLPPSLPPVLHRRTEYAVADADIALRRFRNARLERPPDEGHDAEEHDELARAGVAQPVTRLGRTPAEFGAGVEDLDGALRGKRRSARLRRGVSFEESRTY